MVHFGKAIGKLPIHTTTQNGREEKEEEVGGPIFSYDRGRVSLDRLVAMPFDMSASRIEIAKLRAFGCLKGGIKH